MRGGLLVGLVVAAAVLGWTGGRCSVPDGAGAERTRQLQEAVDTARIVREALDDTLAVLEAEAARDSVRLAVEREQAERRADHAEQRAAALADRLRERVDDDTRPMLDSLVVFHEKQIAALHSVIAGQDSLAASLRGRIANRDALIGALRDELTAERKLAEEWRRRYEREASWWRGLGKSSGTLAIGAAVGAAAVLTLGG